MRAYRCLYRRVLTGMVSVLALLAAAASAQRSHDSSADARFEEAFVAYERNHWDESYAAFAALADKGHRESARIALQMWRHGRALYRTSFVAGPDQVQRWSRVASCGDGALADGCQMAKRVTEQAR